MKKKTLDEQVSRIKNMMGINENIGDSKDWPNDGQDELQGLEIGGENECEEYHGSPYDRGRADAYYGRPKNPHKYPNGTYKGEEVKLTDPNEIECYLKGYDGMDDRKDWGY